jgi:drug/metabolite transporter (DMT)-like permease
MTASSQRPVAGFVLSLITAMMWGVLPIVLKELLAGMDATTIVWYRFLVAFVLLVGWLAIKGQLPPVRANGRRVNAMLLVATLALCANYFLFSYSLNFVNAETSEAVIQLTSLFLILGGVLVFGEPFVAVQKLGTAVLVAGLLLFFNERLRGFTDLDSQETVGVIIVVFAAITWTVYALLQKRLLRNYSSVQILTCIYAVSIIVLLPFISPGSVLQLSSWQLALLAFCCLNTLVAYGCFAEALNLWDASKVSATIALAPLFTISALKLIVFLEPAYPHSDRLSLLSIVGAGMLVLGSVLTALVPVYYRRKRLALSEAGALPDP